MFSNNLVVIFPIHLLQRGNQEMEGGEMEKRREEKRINMCYVHIPTPHREYNHCVLQICNDENTTTKISFVIQI